MRARKGQSYPLQTRHPALGLIGWGLAAAVAGLATAVIVAIWMSPVPVRPRRPAALAVPAVPPGPDDALSTETTAAISGAIPTRSSGQGMPPGWEDPVALARAFVRLAGTGNMAVTTTVIPGWTVPDRLTQLSIAPQAGGAALPGSGPELRILLPVVYQPDQGDAWGYLRVETSPVEGGYLVTGVEGPIAPRQDWETFSLPLLDSNRAPLPPLEGPAILWSPRRPEPGLVTAMEAVRRELAGQVPVLMAVDPATPGRWEQVARDQGWKGEILWVRGYVDAFPLPATWPFLGAEGVLIHPSGRVVASLGELDPSRYNLPVDSLPETARAVAQAYGLLAPEDGTGE